MENYLFIENHEEYKPFWAQNFFSLKIKYYQWSSEVWGYQINLLENYSTY